jgi:hypothetical protein
MRNKQDSDHLTLGCSIVPIFVHNAPPTLPALKIYVVEFSSIFDFRSQDRVAQLVLPRRHGLESCRALREG